MDVSKFEKQRFATVPRADYRSNPNGRPQREKIPRTTAIKRLWKRAKSGLSLKAWARTSEEASAWLSAK